MKNKIIPILLILCSLILSTSFSVNSYADTQTAFYIKHVHTGDSSLGTGCYTSPIYHTHSIEGGECYSPVYHTHEGSPNVCGGCYTVPVLHYHTGDSSGAGGCYVAKQHQHSSHCYEYGTCEVILFTNYITNHDKYCSHHGDMSFAEYEIVEEHYGCGARPSYIIDVCPTCGSDLPEKYTHEYSKLTCTIPPGTVEGYVLGCGHTEGDVDHYEPGCNLEGTIIRYELTCSKTGNDIDGYEVGCGIDEGAPIAGVVVSNDGNGLTQEVNVTAKIEDLTEGKISFEDAVFIWHDKDGNDIGNGESVSITQNGTYEVEVIIDNPCVDQNSLKGEVTVNNIYDPSAHPHNEKDDREQEQDTPENADTEETGIGNETGNTEENLSENMNENITVIPIKTPETIDAAATDEEVPEENTRKPIRKKTDTEAEPKDISSKSKDKDIIKPTPKKEKETVYTEITYGNNDETMEVDSTVSTSGISGFFKKLGDFIKTPKGKMITISLGTVAGLGVLFLLLYLLRNLVIVFNDDTDRKRHIIGIVKVTLKEEGYCLEIPESISQKAYTNRYAFFMKMFMIGRKPDTDILISLEDKRIVVKLSGIIETII